MKTIRIGKFELSLYSEAETRAIGHTDQMIELTPGVFFYAGNLNKIQLFEMAGYEGPIDPAVPQPWFDARLNEARARGQEFDGWKWAWWYGGENKIFGEPISIDTALIRLRKLALAILIEKPAEHADLVLRENAE